MFKEIKSRRLALLVAISLSAGSMFAPSAYAQDVTITTDPPSGLPMNTDSGSGGRAGYAITDVSSSADVTGNTLTLSGVGYTLGGDLYGGYTAGSGTVSGNRLTINAGNDVHGNPNEVHGRAFGGYSERGAATGNTVTIQSGTVGAVVGGDARGVGKEASGNTVNIFGGEVQGNVYGGQSVSGEATRNTVNIGDGTHALTNDEIYGKIIGGSTPGAADKVTGNTLNIKTNVKAVNIENFETINFHIGSAVNYSDPMLTLVGSAQTDMKLGSVKLVGERDGATKLMRNADGFHLTDVSAGDTPLNVRSVTDTHESYILAENLISGRYRDISHYRWQFKGVNKEVSTGQTTPADVFGGYSGIGNMTTGNEVKITGGNHANIYGALTTGAGTTATDAAKKNHSYKNKVTIDPTAGQIVDVYGGYAESLAGNAVDNKVFINGGQMSGSVYGGYSSHADATENEVTVAGGTMTDVYGGHTANPTGKATGNIVNLGDGTQELAAGTTIRDIYGGHGAGTDLTTGNTLNVKASATVRNIFNFDKINFYFDQDKNLNPTLTLNGATSTTIKSLSDITLHGTVSGTGTLLTNANGFTITDGQNSASKTGEKIESIVSRSGNDITYEGNQFKDNKTTVNTATESGITSTWGGRSKVGNTTTGNEITVASGTHTNIYGGWTTGTGSTAAAADRSDSKSNEITVNGSATVSGTVYGGFTSVNGGAATGNVVTVEKAITGAVVGGKALGDASGNTVTVKANAGAVTGGDGATTNNNTVNVEGGVTVGGTITGGMAANGTSNTLNIKGTNTAQNITGFQKVNFDASNVASGATMLHLSTGATTLDKSAIDATGSTVNGGVTLLENANGITINGFGATDNILKSEMDATTEKNIGVERNGTTITKVTYAGYQFVGVTTAVTSGTDAYGGISKAGNSTHSNSITVNGSYTNVYGGHTSGSGTSATGDAANNSYGNTVTITGGTITGKVYGGYTDIATGTTTGNTVNLGDGTNALSTGTNLSNAELYGGNRMATDNTLNVNTAATVGKIENFSKFTFKDAASKLTLTNTGTINLDALAANFDATANEVTLVESANALTLVGGKTFKSDLSTVGTQTRETNIEVRDSNTKIVRYGYTIAGATAATTVGADTWGGRSKAGNTTTGNEITVNDSSNKTIYGGYTTGTGSSATGAARNDSHTNTVNLTGGIYTNVYGGRTDVAGGRAFDNIVNVTGAVTGNITGGEGTVTNNNRINLRNATVNGIVRGGTAANGTGNTLAVDYGTGSSSIGDFSGIQNLHFDLQNAPTDGTAHTLLKLTNAVGEKNLSNVNLGVYRTGAAKKLEKGDTFTLMENTTAGGSVSIGDNVTAEGRDGVSRNYTFDITKDASGKLIATVIKAGLGEQAKSLVETRAGASAFLNDGGDYIAGAGMDTAQREARAAAMNSGSAYGLWAGMGGGSLRHETGSYVDMKGWNLGVGWARENAVKEGTLTFGPFIEYGRGSYDSYLDDGTHGSGKTSYIGAGVMAKLETKANNWIDGALRVGRTKSDYTGLASYDTSSTYYAMHVGIGKDFRVKSGDTVSAYARYSYAHTAATSAHLSSGETYDFDAVNSHRLRIGTRYTHGETMLSQFYAGLAWEYEFDGDARAAYDGDSAPSPSLKGSSGMLELGYRFVPKADSRMNYDLHLNGWQGKRKGVTGGVSVKWAF